MIDLFHFNGPTCVSFSGGRTSAYMLRRILDSHGGALPENIIVCFANTGKERNETLDFVRAVETNWGVKINWLEFGGKKTFSVVDYITASRKGEPFERLIVERSYLPNPVTRFCTVELKIKTMHRFLSSLGWKEWTMVVGLRADEPRRVTRILGRKESKSELVACPLYTAHVTKAMVLEYWAEQCFDLRLQSYEGNCDLCFLKGIKKREQVIIDHPELAEWWVAMETKLGKDFRANSPNYATLVEKNRGQKRLLPLLEDDPTDVGECLCTD